MTAPALLKSLCDRCGECANLADPNSQFNPTTQGDDFNLEIDNRLLAMTTCNKRARREDSAKKLFQYYCGWLRRQITLSFSLSNGAGAFSISLVLEVQVYRGRDAWVETKLSNGFLFKIGEIRDSHLLQQSENELISDFQQAISAGKMGPRDISWSGIAVVEVSKLIPSYLDQHSRGGRCDSRADLK
jgi:hypothetical protein